MVIGMSVISLPQGSGAQTARQRVATEVRALMGRYNVTQMDLTRVLGVSQTGISKRLHGKIPFDVDEIAALAAYFSVLPGDLFGAPPPEGGGPSKSTLLRSYRILNAA